MEERRVLNEIGNKLYQLRKERGLTLQELSTITNVAPSTLQKIERNRMNPTISVLMKICRGLQIRIGHFFNAEIVDNGPLLIRKGERPTLVLDKGRLIIEDIAMDVIGSGIRAVIQKISPGGRSGKERLFHRGNEVVFCLKGEIVFEISGKRYILKEGDCLNFDGRNIYSWKNVSPNPTELLIITSVPHPPEHSERN